MVQELLSFVHYVFGVPYAWLTFPEVIGWFFIPLGLLIAIFYVFLEKGIRVLPMGGNIALAIIISLLCSRIAVMTSSMFGMIGGIVVLSFALVGLSALFYRFAVDFVIIFIWIVFLIFACIKYVDWSLIVAVYGFFVMIGVLCLVFRMIKWTTFLVLILLFILSIILPPLILQHACSSIRLFI